MESSIVESVIVWSALAMAVGCMVRHARLDPFANRPEPDRGAPDRTSDG
jgi:hypothetical protein